MHLTARDTDLLRFLAEPGVAPLEILARRFFAKNPHTGKANKRPIDAAAVRLRRLAREGYVRLSGTTVAGHYCPYAQIERNGAIRNRIRDGRES